MKHHPHVVMILGMMLGFVLIQTVTVFADMPVTYGDVTGDGQITALDASYVLQAAAGKRILTASQRLAADVDRDGQITSFDAKCILAYRAGLIGRLPVQRGDVTGNGTLSVLDATYILQSLAGTRTLTASQKFLADVDQDGAITAYDAKLIIGAVSGVVKLSDHFGDLTGNGTLSALDATYILQSLAGTRTLTASQKFLADVDQDGKITNSDAKLILASVTGLIKLPARYGDLTGNGQVSALDATYILQFLAHTRTLTPAQKFLADVDEDGKITKHDSELILQYLTGSVSLLPPPQAPPADRPSPDVYNAPVVIQNVIDDSMGKDKSVQFAGIKTIVDRNETISEKHDSVDPRMIAPPDVNDQTHRDIPKK